MSRNENRAPDDGMATTGRLLAVATLAAASITAHVAGAEPDAAPSYTARALEYGAMIRAVRIAIEPRTDAGVDRTAAVVVSEDALLHVREPGGVEPEAIVATPVPPVDDLRDVAIGDLDGDGRLDVVIVGTLLREWRGTAAGAFVERSSRALPGLGAAARLVDVDADGDLDLLVDHFDEAGLRLFRNDGTGGLGDAEPIASGAGGRALAAGDLDGDGDVDVVRTASDGGLAIVEQRADGTFAPSIALGAGGAAPVLVDWDGDGDLDLVHVTDDDEGVVLLRNVGGFAFVPGGTCGLPSGRIVDRRGLHRIVPADVNADGIIDLLVPAESPDAVVAFVGDGAGDFAPREGIDAGIGVRAVVVGDVDADLRGDLLVACRASGSVVVFPGGGGGIDLPRGPRSDDDASDVAAGDLDGDGDPDLVVAGRKGVLVAWNDGGTFGPLVVLDPQGTDGIDVADLEPDGDADLIAFDAGGVRLHRGLGAGRFAPRETILEAPIGGIPVGGVADVDGDGRIDVWCNAAADGLAGLVIGWNDGPAGWSTSTIPCGEGPVSLGGIGDVDGDGDDDAICFSRSEDGTASTRTVHRNVGARRFVAEPTVVVDAPTLVAFSLAVDVDGDRDVDLIDVRPIAGGMTAHDLRMNDGDGDFRLVQTIPSPSPAYEACVVDIDGDGFRDLALARWVPPVVRRAGDSTLVLLARGDGTFRVGGRHVASRGVARVEAADVDRDGDQELLRPRELGGVSILDNLRCGCDLDGDGRVGTGDLVRVLFAWGPCPTRAPCPEDLEPDGAIDERDLELVLANWGDCPEP